jgi:hypothetical protein
MTLRLVVSVFLLTASLLAGDLTITFTTKGKGPMGVKLDGEETQYYSSRYRLTVNTATRTDTLMDFQDMVTYTILHKEKKIQKMSLEDATAIMEAMQSQGTPGGEGGMSALIGGLFGGNRDNKAQETCKVEEKGQEVIAGRTCKKYAYQIMGIDSESSNDPTLVPPVPAVSFAKMKRMQGAAMSMMGSQSKAWTKYYEELSKIKGLALKTRVKTSGMFSTDSTQEATRVVEGPIPASTFKLPEGYKMEDTGKQLREKFGEQ